ncbi:hypothetical protein IAG44_22915 [Streptomyces roseirectus]|uniref:Uncharacterized protein n=1 Tax=Streptomyces roseirectus TaxID=2768066 RepID=A0A7H0IGR8_9ACTN|nr:hypothetical protein [Streptomyces roseirectus]QNP71984.1 hypothetical protein IAG44_22915 [Streptomyces roseirectus]
MGIESDQVVYEYLSRVGDVAQQQQLASSARMRLVSELRNEIDQRRAKATVDSPAAVRKIIARLGSPDDVVAAAGGQGGPGTPAVAVPVQPSYSPGSPSGSAGPAGPTSPTAPTTPAGPAARADADSDGPAFPAPRSGDDDALPDWWRGGPVGLESDLDEVPGFVGGVEIPELLKSPRGRTLEKKTDDETPATPPADDQTDATATAPGKSGKAEKPGKTAKARKSADAEPRRRRLVPLPSGQWSNPLLLLAAASLVAGAVLGNLIPLGAGWLIAYVSRRLSVQEKKTAVFWIPGCAVGAGLVWLWGRNEGRWGDPIVAGHMNDAVSQTWPWVLRVAAITSALYLVWRSQRNK